MKIARDFSLSVYVFMVVFVLAGLTIIIGGDSLLKVIGSSTCLPVIAVMIVYFIHLFLENFHSMCATMIVTNNEVPFVKAAIASGGYNSM